MKKSAPTSTSTKLVLCMEKDILMATWFKKTHTQFNERCNEMHIKSRKMWCSHWNWRRWRNRKENEKCCLNKMLGHYNYMYTRTHFQSLLRVRCWTCVCVCAQRIHFFLNIISMKLIEPKERNKDTREREHTHTHWCKSYIHFANRTGKYCRLPISMANLYGNLYIWSIHNTRLPIVASLMNAILCAKYLIQMWWKATYLIATSRLHCRFF